MDLGDFLQGTLILAHNDLHTLEQLNTNFKTLKKRITSTYKFLLKVCLNKTFYREKKLLNTFNITYNHKNL